MISKIEKILISIILFLTVIGVYFAYTDLLFFEGTYVREDGFIEWLTVLALLFGAFTSWKRALIVKNSKGLLFLFSLIIFGCVFLFGAGEEISWGQRIFEIESPEFFKKHNSQMETNFHNLIIEGKKINKIIFGLALGIGIVFYFLVLPVLYTKFEKVKKLINNFAIPLPKLGHIIAYMILFGLVSITPSGKKGELLEFGGCCLFSLMIFFPRNREIFPTN